MSDQVAAPLDAAAASDAAFARISSQPFPQDIFAAPQLRWAVIGCGVIANQMAQVMALAGRPLAGVANRTIEKARAIAERYGVERVYESYDELYADPASMRFTSLRPITRISHAAGSHGDKRCVVRKSHHLQPSSTGAPARRRHGVVLWTRPPFCTCRCTRSWCAAWCGRIRLG